MANIRHTVVVRRDLNLSPGLLAAQVAHINDNFMRKRILNKILDRNTFSEEEYDWMAEPYLSVLAVNNVEELNIIKEEAEKAQLQVHVWVDVIHSEILQRPIKVLVGLSIGPADFDQIKLITGTLPLY